MELLFVDKPAGVTTHTSHGGDSHDGFIEYLSARSGQNLLVTHRLDRDTTGAICFAKTEAAANSLREKFLRHSVKKRYLFLTDRTAKQKQFELSTHIERRGNTFVSIPGPANAHTRFKLLDESDGLYLWEALPTTGKSHQIRLHAEASGIAILGDDVHGGSPFETLCLHSEHLVIEDDDILFASQPPRWFLKRHLCRDPLLVRWLVAIDRRERLLRSWLALGDQSLVKNRTLRWIHSEGDPLRAEQLGSVYVLSWFSERGPSAPERASLETLTQELGWENWYLQIRRDRGQSPQTHEVIQGPGEIPQTWLASENNLSFEMRKDQGLSPGLFLDQRLNRRWVLENSRGHTVLNLFCYSGGFSVAAAAGGARQVVSVDLSKTFIDWTRANFLANHLPLEGHEFRAIDAREYLRWAIKKGLTFDLVICDPPSFSRPSGNSRSGVFRITQDFETLVKDLLKLTKTEGKCLFSTNYEGWDRPEFERRLQAQIHGDAKLINPPTPDWDFELPLNAHNMKSAIIVK